jgi:monofunctional biosynthetic peptidoglycan transglycosylase
VRRIIKYLLLVLFVYLAYIVVTLALLPPVSELANRKYSAIIQVKDWQGNYHPLIVGPKNPRWTNSNGIAPEMKWAVILAEDSNFYKHEGFDVNAIKKAIKYDLEKKSFARGASTITQQTAKNLYLSREKTITRKLKEIYLAWRMEQELTKGRIIELYLNVVELGPMVHGIGHGARYYFGKSAADLTPRECAFLAAMLPGPRVAYNPYKNLNKVVKRSDLILRLMRQRAVISEEEYQVAMAAQPNIAGMQRKIDMVTSAPPVFTSTSSAAVNGTVSEQKEKKEQAPDAPKNLAVEPPPISPAPKPVLSNEPQEKKP